MKKLFYLFLLIPFAGFSQTPDTEKGIHFKRGTFAELLEKAKKENKMVMVDGFTTWCGHCKWMAKNIFPNDTVAAYYNSNFISAEIDMEKGEGLDIAKKYKVTCYPTFLFIDNSGELKHRMSGSMQTKEFIQLGMNAMDPAKQFTAYQEKYDSGTISPDEMGEYVLMLGRTCMPVKDAMAKYFSTQSDADLLKPKNCDILFANSYDLSTESREFKYMVAHKAEFDKVYKDKNIDMIIKNAYVFTLNQCIKEKNSEKYNAIKQEVIKNNFSFGEQLTLNSDIIFYKYRKDWTNYAQTGVKYIDKFAKEDNNALNSMAWNFYENINDKAMLLKAEEWAKHSVELQPAYANTDTYAAVLYKLGKKSEAQATAEKAIELAKKEGQDYSETQTLLDKIKAMK